MTKRTTQVSSLKPGDIILVGDEIRIEAIERTGKLQVECPHAQRVKVSRKQRHHIVDEPSHDTTAASRGNSNE